PQLRHGGFHLRPENYAVEPWGLFLLEQVQEHFQPASSMRYVGPVKTLRRYPDLRFGMITVQDLFRFFHQLQQKVGADVTGIAARNEDYVDARQFFEDFLPLLQSQFHS